MGPTLFQHRYLWGAVVGSNGATNPDYINQTIINNETTKPTTIITNRTCFGTETKNVWFVIVIALACP